MNLPLHMATKALLISFSIIVLSTNGAAAVDYHVSPTGSDAHDGSQGSPFLTIGKAAATARAGDVITVHEGTYRERINPRRGGNSEENRNVYQAAPQSGAAWPFRLGQGRCRCPRGQSLAEVIDIQANPTHQHEPKHQT